VTELKKNYRQNPFHNFVHALTVTHSLFVLLTVSEASEIFDAMDICGMLIAGMGHDTGHRGRTNAFEMASDSELSLVYNDKHVLENHHAS